jgi:serine/threonine-protein phosphatase 2A regulatory subunit B
MASNEGSPAVAWRYAQCFGDREAETCVDADKLTAVQHSHNGRFLATGDKGGRVVIFERTASDVNVVSFLWGCVFLSCFND